MINHPNIVKLSEAFRRKEKLCLVFEFVDFSLLELIEKNQGGIKVKVYKTKERADQELHISDIESHCLSAQYGSGPPRHQTRKSLGNQG